MGNSKIEGEKGKQGMIALSILVFLVLTGDIVSYEKIRLFGVVVSAYRVLIPVFFVAFIGIRMYQKSMKQLLSRRTLMVYMSLMAFWIVWGAGLIFISPYTGLRGGLNDIISLALGMASVYCFCELCESEEWLEKVFRLIRLICVILCAWALVEVFTGLYLPYSKYYWLDRIEMKNWHAVVLQGLKDDSLFTTTTIFYNVNDFSAFLSIFLPLFFVSEKNTKKENLRRGLGFFLMVFIIGVNDSNIALIGIVLSAVFYFALSEKKYAGRMLAILFLLLVFGNKLLFSFLVTVKSNLPFDAPVIEGGDPITELAKRRQIMNVSEAMEDQALNAMNGSANSLMTRWQITLTSFRMMLKSKFMGIGPDGFTNYVKKNEKGSHLVDPHNWWMEILSQYGIFVFVAYIAVMALIFYKVWNLFQIKKKFYYLAFLCMCITFCLACIASSGYLNYTYYWLLPAIGIAIIGFSSRREEVRVKKQR